MVAVSGGGDSMALAHLLAGWGRPVAAIVDHGLRPEATAEARQAAERLAAIGIPSHILSANLDRGPAAAERARDARYRLLLDYCRDTGRPDLLLGHHAHDQAETVCLRHERGSGVAGLAGMASIEYRAEARLLRPLLTVEPERLRQTLRRAGLSWVDDPGNTDPATARGRLRATLTASDRAAYLDQAAEAAARRVATERLEAIATAELRPEGFAILGPDPDPATLSAAIWAIAGRPYPPPSDLLRRPGARTGHGVLIRPAGRLGPGMLIQREPAAVAAPVPAIDGAVWDGRFRLSGAVPPGCTLGALGADSARFRDRSTLPATILATLPALRRGAEIACVPHLLLDEAETCRNLTIDFRPRRPVAPMPFAGIVNTFESRGV